MKSFAAILVLVLSVCQPATAKPGGAVKKPEPVAVVRLLYPSGKEYGCAVPVGDKLVAPSHANCFDGQTIRCRYKGMDVTRAITKVVRVKVKGISAGEGDQNRSGDITVLTLDSPLPYWIERQTLVTGPPFGKKVELTWPDGTKAKLTVLPLATRSQQGYASIPDGLNPRWLIFAPSAATQSKPGASGGAITWKGHLISIRSRGNAGPNIGHIDVQLSLIPEL